MDSTKTIKVIRSCKTVPQLTSAAKYTRLYLIRSKEPIYKSLLGILDDQHSKIKKAAKK